MFNLRQRSGFAGARFGLSGGGRFVIGSLPEFWRDPVINGTSVRDPAYYDPDTQTSSAQTVSLERGQVASPQSHAHCPPDVSSGWASRVEITTAQDPQTIINANPAGTVFVLKAGVHQDRRIVPRAGEIIVGENGAILDGSGLTAASAPDARAIYSDAANVTLYNIEVRNYPYYDDGTQVPDGAAVRLDGGGGLLYNLYVHDNGNIGIQAMGPIAIIRWCVAARNGRINYLPNNWGGASTRTGVRVEYCESDTGNVANFDQTNEAGGSKFVHCTGGVARFNYFHGDTGYGIWFDGIYNTGVSIEYNVSKGELRSGVHYEIASTGTIRHNTVEGCGGSGSIFLSTSADCVVYDNYIRWGTDGIWVYDENRGGPRGTGNEIYENHIYQKIASGWSVGMAGVMSSEYSSDPATVNNVWHDNHYYVDDGASGANISTVDVFDWGNQDAQKTWAEWQALAGESGSTLEYMAEVDYTPPARPGSLSLTPGDTEIAISWAVESGATVGVYRSLTPGYGFSLVRTSTAGDSGWTDTGLTNGTTYYYRFNATDAAGNTSGWTDTVSAEAGAAPSPQNLIPDSENFGVWIVQQSAGTPTITANYGTGPFGGSAAARFYQPGDTGDYQRFRSSANALTRCDMTSGGTYYPSFYIKPVDGPTTIALGMRSASDVFASGDLTVSANLSTLTVSGATGGVVDAGGGWYRVWWELTAVNTGSFGFFVGLNGYGPNQVHADCQVDCVQVNTGSLKAYAKTTGTALP